jgi:flagellar protein FlaI
MDARDRADMFHKQVNLSPHLRDYMDKWILEGQKLPEFHPSLGRAMAQLQKFNIVYPVGDPCYIHAHRSVDGYKMYIPIEPVMSPKTSLVYTRVLDSMANDICHPVAGATDEQKRDAIRANLTELTAKKPNSPLSGILRALHLGGRPRLRIWTHIDREDYPVIGYFLVRDLIDHGALEPIVRDPYVDLMRSTGAGRLGVMHRVWGSMETGLQFKDAAQLDAMFQELSLHPGTNWTRWKTISFRTSAGKTGLIRR